MFAKESCVHIGKLQKTHGLFGQIILATSYQLTTKEPFLLDIGGGLVPFFVSEDGLKRKDHYSCFVQFDTVGSKEEASKLVGFEVYLENAPEALADEKHLPEKLFAGYTFFNEKKEEIGEILSLEDYSGNRLLVVQRGEKELLIPFVEEKIVEINHEGRIVISSIPDGLLDLY